MGGVGAGVGGTGAGVGRVGAGVGGPTFAYVKPKQCEMCRVLQCFRRNLQVRVGEAMAPIREFAVLNFKFRWFIDINVGAQYM